MTDISEVRTTGLNGEDGKLRKDFERFALNSNYKIERMQNGNYQSECTQAAWRTFLFCRNKNRLVSWLSFWIQGN